jgi:glycerophosphoryl diester phosphodiesterase
MKKWLVIFLSIVFLCVCFVVYTLFFHHDDIELNTVLGAHRGSSVLYIENTLDAFVAALNDPKYDYIEFDVQYTKDKVLVVHHDLSLLRLQQKKVYLEDLTYDELLSVSKYPIPTYTEVMDLVNGSKPLNIEIKSQGNYVDDVEIAHFLVDDFESRGILNSVLLC